jgi:hypothetical protein
MNERLLTYREIGLEFGLSPQAARKRVQRLRLRKVPGNDGKVRVVIPDGMVFTPARTHKNGWDNVRRDGLVDELRQQIKRLQADMAAERTSRIAAEVRAATAEGEALGLRNALKVGEAGRRDAEARAEMAREVRRILESEAD